jgi:signal transduction histidine kinase
MPSEPTPPTSPEPTERLILGLGRRYRFVLFSIALLVVLDQAVIQPQLIRLNLSAPVINLAGRQRMLSQKIAKSALALNQLPAGTSSDARRRELEQALDSWIRVHRGLLDGEGQLDLPGTHTPRIRAAFSELEPRFAAIQKSALNIVQQPAEEAMSDDVATILAQDASYLTIMERIVGMFEAEARDHVQTLRMTGLTLTAIALALLAAVGRFVLRPATELASRQMDRLEQNVAARTRELSTANTALEREIREREQAEQRSRQLQGELAHAARITSIGQLATGLAHELNQPLGAIANYAETADLALDGADPNWAAATNSVHRIRDAALRAGQIVRRMRDFVRPALQRREECSLNGLVREVAELCEPELRRADALVRLELMRDDDTTVADAIQIQQVLVNLIQNGIQAMQSTPRDARTLTLRTIRQGPDLQVEVIDCGHGFTEQTAEAAFTPFVSTKPEGLGMGLALSRSIIVAHRGRLHGEPAPEGGARFTFVLPAAHRAHVSDVAQLPHSPPQATRFAVDVGRGGKAPRGRPGEGERHKPGPLTPTLSPAGSSETASTSPAGERELRVPHTHTLADRLARIPGERADCFCGG